VILDSTFLRGYAKNPGLEAVGADALAWNDALAAILKYSLLHRDTNAGTLQVHRLVQAVLKAGMGAATQRLWAERAVRAINRAFPYDVEFSKWALCERLLPQAHTAMELIKEWGFEFREAARLLNQAGFYLSECARYPEAEPLLERALAIREQALGPEHPKVATALENYAFLLRVIGRPDDAAPMETRARAIRAKSC
jgi:tetratricopeptide (TPR) repeat protein